MHRVCWCWERSMCEGHAGPVWALTDSILNEAGVCELLKRLSSFSAPSPSLSPLFTSHFSLSLSHTLVFLLPPFCFTLLYQKKEGQCDLWTSSSVSVCVCVCVMWVMLVNPGLSLGTDLAHITACYYSVWNLLCIQTVIIYCNVSFNSFKNISFITLHSVVLE